MIVAPVLLILFGTGLWFSDVLPPLPGMNRHEKQAVVKPVPPSYVDVPQMVANLNGRGGNRYAKLAVRVEVPKPKDVEPVKAAMPRLQDLLVDYMRKMHPAELHDPIDTHRLRGELLERANAAVAPAMISDILFTQMLVQ